MFNLACVLLTIVVPLVLLFFLVRSGGRWLRQHTSFNFQTVLYALCLVGFLGLIILHTQNLKYSKKDLVEIKGRLKAAPEMTSAVRAGAGIKIMLVGQPYNYKTDGFSYHVLKEKALRNEVKIGDTITIGYPRLKWYSYRGWVNQTIGTIHFVELYTDEKEYASLKDYNKLQEDDAPWTYGFWLFTLVIYIYWFVKRKRGEEPWRKSEVN